MFTDSDIIHAYTRADAIEDGGLVDVSTVAQEAGFVIPVAVTRAVWADCVEWSDADNNRKGTIQDEAGRLWDVVYTAVLSARRARGDRAAFTLYRVPRNGRGTRPCLTTLCLHIGPGDAGDPVITIMIPGED